MHLLTRELARQDHATAPTNLWSSTTCSCGTYVADLGLQRLDLAEEEHAQDRLEVDVEDEGRTKPSGRWSGGVDEFR